MKTPIDSYNELVPTMNRLLKEDKEIWEFHGSLSGFGFKVIEEKTYVEVRVTTDYGAKVSSFSITKYKRKGNVFNTVSDKELDSKETSNYKEVYSIIKKMLGND